MGHRFPLYSQGYHLAVTDPIGIFSGTIKYIINNAKEMSLVIKEGKHVLRDDAVVMRNRKLVKGGIRPYVSRLILSHRMGSWDFLFELTSLDILGKKSDLANTVLSFFEGGRKYITIGPSIQHSHAKA